MEVTLNDNEVAILQYLKLIYENLKKGSNLIMFEEYSDDIGNLLQINYIFQTEEGFFISTFGLEYLANLSEKDIANTSL